MIPPETSSDSAQPQAARPLEYAATRVFLTTGDGARSFRIGIRCWLLYVLLVAIAYVPTVFFPAKIIPAKIIGGLCAIICLTILTVAQMYAVYGFIDGCRSLKSETREWRGIAGLVVNAAALLPIPCAVLAAIAFG